MCCILCNFYVLFPVWFNQLYFLTNKWYYLPDLLWTSNKPLNSFIAFPGITGVGRSNHVLLLRQVIFKCLFCFILKQFFFSPPDTVAHSWDQFISRLNRRWSWKYVRFNASWSGFYLQQHGDRWPVCLQVGAEFSLHFSTRTICVWNQEKKRLFARHRCVYGKRWNIQNFFSQTQNSDLMWMVLISDRPEWVFPH